MIYLQLYFEFFKTGLFTIGGALAAIPFLREMSDKTGWFTHAQLADMIAVSESTPGPIGINMATYVGYTVSGVPGGIIATLGIITPSLIIVLIVAGLLSKFSENSLVKSAFYGLRPATLGLITAAGLSVLSLTIILPKDLRTPGSFHSFINIKALLLAVVLFPLMRRIKTHPIVFLAGSAAAGIVLKF